jgi:hypothetical protein
MKMTDKKSLEIQLIERIVYQDSGKQKFPGKEVCCQT